MGPRMTSRVVIARPAEEVFRFFLDLDVNAPKTDPRLLSVAKTPRGPTEAGTTFRFRQKMLGRVRETTTRFTSVEPNRKIAFEAKLGPIEPTAVLIFEESDAATNVTFSGEANPVGPFRFKLFSPLIKRQGQREWDKRLAVIKAVLERPAS
jgi:polyketide cyclase/dehydrase/lipid transport protein